MKVKTKIRDDEEKKTTEVEPEVETEETSVAEEGIPEEKEETGEKTDDDIEIELPEEFAKDESFIKLIEEGGLSQQQVDLGVKYFQNMQERANEGIKKQRAQDMKKLREEWGEDFDKRLGKARQTVKLLDKKVPGVVQFLQRTGAASDPLVIRVMEAVASDLKDTTTAKKEETDKTRRTPKKKVVIKTNKARKQTKKTGWDKPPLERLYPTDNKKE